jgi:hypothetical protein
MEQRIEKVVNAFTGNGWKMIGPLNISREWWFDDIILLEFEWKPVGTKLYLTLLTDPKEIKRKTVWAISLSSSMPEQRNLKPLSQIALNDVKKTNLENFVKTINGMML